MITIEDAFEAGFKAGESESTPEYPYTDWDTYKGWQHHFEEWIKKGNK